jgi:hypothetical protein
VVSTRWTGHRASGSWWVIAACASAVPRPNLPPFPPTCTNGSVLHDPRPLRTSRRHSDDPTEQGGPARPARTRRPARGQRSHRARRPRADPCPAGHSRPRSDGPTQKTSYIPDLLVYPVATVCAIVLGLMRDEQGFDRLALVLDRWGVVETALAVLIASALAGLLCVLVPLMRRLIHLSRDPHYPELPGRSPLFRRGEFRGFRDHLFDLLVSLLALVPSSPVSK